MILGWVESPSSLMARTKEIQKKMKGRSATGSLRQIPVSITNY